MSLANEQELLYIMFLKPDASRNFTPRTKNAARMSRGRKGNIMLKVLGFGASPRPRGNTDHLLSAALAGARQQGALTEEFQLRDQEVAPCIGCELCRKAEICIGIEDDMQDIYPRIIEAQGIILASPTHNYNITAWMKAFIDRLYCFYHFSDDRPRRYRPLLSPGRKAVVIAVCEQTDPRDMGFTLEAMTMPLEALGFEVVGQLPVYGIFDLGAVKEQDEVMAQAEALGRELAEECG